jgi:hypothetical protein
MRGQRDSADNRGPSLDPRRAAERVLEDETLRGDLSDEAYLPLLNVVLALGQSRACLFPDTDALSQAMRSFVRDAVALLECRDEAALEVLASSSLLLPGERPEMRATSLPADPEAASVELAHVVGQITDVTDGP